MNQRAAMGLGWRLVRTRDRRVWSSRLMIVVGVCLAVVSMLVCAAAARVFPAQSHRSVERSFSVAGEGREALGQVSVHRLPFGDRMILRVDVALADERLDMPVGLDRWPRQGEVILSPAARELYEHHGDFADFVPGVVSELVIDESGLRSPDELVAYRGVSGDDLPQGGQAVANTGPLILDTPPPSNVQIAGLTGVVALLVGFPSASFLIIAGRLSAATRRQRLSVLHFLGASKRTIRQANGVEMVVLAAVGWLAGLALYPIVNVIFAGSSLLGTTWFASDTSLTWVWVLASGLIVGIWVFQTHRRIRIDIVHTRALTRKAEASAVRSFWWFLPLCGGLNLLTTQVVMGASHPAGSTPLRLDLLMTASILLTGLGLVLALPGLIHRTGRFLERRGPSLAARIGGARAAFAPTANSGLVVCLALFVMIAGVTIGQTKDARAVSQPVDPRVVVTVSANELPRGVASLIRSHVHAPNYVLVASQSETQPRYVVAIGTCHDVEEAMSNMAAFDFPDCSDNSILISQGFNERVLDTHPLLGAVIPQTSRHASLPSHASMFLAEGGVAGLVTVDGQSVLEAVEPGPRTDSEGVVSYTEDALLVMIVARQDLTHVLGTIYKYAPYSQPSAMGLDPDSGNNIARINGFIRLGLILGTIMTLAALITATVDRIAARRPADQEMILTGAPRDLIRNIHRWEISTTIIPGTTLALLSGLLGGLAWQYAGGLDRTPDWTSMTTLTAITILVIILLTQTATRAVPLHTNREQVG